MNNQTVDQCITRRVARGGVVAIPCANGFFLSALLLIASLTTTWGESVWDQGTKGDPKAKIGRITRDPASERTLYRTVSRTDQRITPQAVPGLYISTDEGETWKLLCRTLDFSGLLYVHPKTGRLYASICDESLATDNEGYLVKRVGYKLVTSTDGKKWKDITPDHGSVALVMGIFQDPKHADRVCFYVSLGMRSFVLQSSDSDYSNWIRHDEQKDDMSLFEAELEKAKGAEGSGQ